MILCCVSTQAVAKRFRKDGRRSESFFIYHLTFLIWPFDVKFE